MSAATFEDYLQINTPEHPLRGRNTLISALRTHHSDHVHILPPSIKFAIAGEIDVETRRRSYRLNNQRFLVLNAWEPYTFQISPGSQAQTFSLFFRRGFLSGVQNTLLGTDSELLDNIDNNTVSQHLEFPEALFSADSHYLGRLLRALFEAWGLGVSQHCLADRVRDIAEALVRLRTGTLTQLGNIDAIKHSTREEIFRRTQVAMIFIRENYHRDIDLNVVARYAGMAPHHLHRNFHRIYGLTVHREIVRSRLNEARRLLEFTDIPISRICNRIGYASTPSFTNLFKHHFGRSPSECRRPSNWISPPAGY